MADRVRPEDLPPGYTPEPVPLEDLPPSLRAERVPLEDLPPELRRTGVERLVRGAQIPAEAFNREFARGLAIFPEALAQGTGAAGNLAMRSLGLPEKEVPPIGTYADAAERGAERLGVVDPRLQPETPAERVLARAGEFAGQGASQVALPVAAGAQVVRGAPLGAEMLRKGMAAELIGGAGVGAASGVAEEAFPGSAVAQILATLGSAALGSATYASTAASWRRMRAAEKAQKRLAREMQGISPELPGDGTIPRPDPSKFEFNEAEATAMRAGLTEYGTQRMVDPGVHESIVAAGEELLTLGGVRRDLSRSLTDQMSELLATRRITGEQFMDVMRKHDMTPEEFAQVWFGGVRAQAQAMNRLSQASKRISKWMEGEEYLDELDDSMGRSGMGPDWWKRATNAWRGLLVTQAMTAMRNLLTQVGRVGLLEVQQSLDAVLPRLIPGARAPKNPVMPFQEMVRLFSRGTREQVDEVLSAWPQAEQRMFYRYSSDVARATDGGQMGSIEKGVNALNILNRTQEFWMRRGVFAASLDRRLAAKGVKLHEISERGELGRYIDDDMIRGAVDDALDATWAREFDPTGGGTWENAAGSIIRMVNAVPGAGFVLPFPRFMANAIKFQVEHSPFGFIKAAVKPSEWKKIADGDTSTLSKAMVGSTMLWTAYQLRNSEYAGERWYEIKIPEGSIPEDAPVPEWMRKAQGGTVDIRPFNPFASYLFAAEVIRRGIDPNDRVMSMSLRDAAQGLLATNLRAGAGLYLVDELIEGVAGIRPTSDPLEIAGGAAVNIGAGVLTPLAQLRDAASAFEQMGMEDLAPDPRLVDRRIHPYSAPLTERLPYGREIYQQLTGQEQAEVELPTREEAPERVVPWLRQVSGLSLRDPKSEFEAELDRLQLNRSDILKSSGVPEFDAAVAHELGPILQDVGNRLVNTAGYKRGSNIDKRIALKLVMEEPRSRAMLAAIDQNPVAFLEKVARGLPRDYQWKLEELTGMSYGDLVRQLEERVSDAGR